jgi:DNA-directed RNA polymerase subunit RPC12/RpoP
MTRCPVCGGKLVEVERERILSEPDLTEMSDDELIEYFSEEITGNYEKWGADRITYVCAQCGEKFMTKHGEDD